MTIGRAQECDPKAKPGKAMKSDDEKRSKNEETNVAWKAFVGSVTSNEPNLANALNQEHVFCHAVQQA
jgi:hypothetical protein